MFKVICVATLLLTGLLTYVIYDQNYTSRVYGCSEENLPPDVQQKCKKYMKKPSPRMENGCVIQNIKEQEFKICG